MDADPAGRAGKQPLYRDRQTHSLDRQLVTHNEFFTHKTHHRDCLTSVVEQIPKMRLLDTATLQLEEFFESSEFPNSERLQLARFEFENMQIPKYAILSHTWGLGEITFQDMPGNRVLAERTARFAKVRDSCRQARRDGYGYIWIDTCCIDKTSSTELSEAINSMYQWYKNSAVCYVYLSDVDENPFDRYSRTDRNIYHSRWFTRGWTLQELIPPPPGEYSVLLRRLVTYRD